MQNWLASWGTAMHQKHFIHDFFHAHAVGFCSPYVASSLGYSAHGHCKLGESLTFFHTWAWHIQQVAKLGTSSILHLVSLPNIHILGMHDSHPCWLGTCVKLPGSFTLAVLSHAQYITHKIAPPFYPWCSLWETLPGSPRFYNYHVYVLEHRVV